MKTLAHFQKIAMASFWCFLALFANTAAAVNAPYTVTVTYNQSQNSATVKWGSDTSPTVAFGYDIERRISGTEPWTKVGYVKEPARTFTNVNLAPLTRYVYRVVAFRPGGPAAGYVSTSLAATPLNFPYNVAYPGSGHITPNLYNQNQKNIHVQNMWNQWRSVYLKTDSVGTRVFSPAGGESVSEGTGYGMLISVYMATESNTGKADFDGIFKFYKKYWKTNDQGVNIGLMSWRVQGNGNVLPADNYVAPDGDIDAAYALLVADKKWGSAGTINYKDEAVKIINNLMAYTVHNRKSTDSFLINKADMKLGRTETVVDHTMSSYQIVSYFDQFQKASNDPRWTQVRNAGYKFYNHFYSATGNRGLTPFTFLSMPNGNQYKAVSKSVEPTLANERSHNFGYDSSRVPWRVGMDFLWYGTSHSALAKSLPNRNVDWFQSATGSLPQNAMQSYELNGAGTHPVGSYNANLGKRNMVASMAVGAMTDSSNQAWLNTMYDWMIMQSPGQPYTANGSTTPAEYYADTVLMVCMLAVTGNMPNLPAVPTQ